MLNLFFVSLFVLYSFQYTDLSNPLLRSFDSFCLSFVDNVTAGTYNFVSLIVKKILSGLASVLSLPTAAKTQCFIYLINGNLSDLQKPLRYFNGTAFAACCHVVEFHRYYLVHFESLFSLLI